MSQQAFESLRRRLFGIAYRMLGSVEDAQDSVEEAYARFHESQASGIENSEAWLVSVVTRLCIDRLRRAETERAAYVGNWLPEPLATAGELTPQQGLERREQLSVAFLLLLERLNGPERAVFVLREVFDYDYPLVAAAVGKSEAATRQLLHRAKEHVQQHHDGSDTRPLARGLVQRFLSALERGDPQSLLELLSPEVRLVSDGGGKVAAARNVIEGADRVARFFLGLRNKPGVATVHRQLELNGAAGWVSLRHERTQATTVIECDAQRITAFYRVLNPDKLRALQASP
ncbi:MAG: RNA polymerase sigma factor SigJ [Polyangiaceae bacterium]